MNIYVVVLLRTLLAIAVLLLLCRLDGSKQISQLTFYDYIVGITAGSIAASLCIERDISIWEALIGIVLFMLSSMFFSMLTSKSIFMRRALTGRPVFLIAEGKICYDGLKKCRYDTDDLLRELRSQGYFDINQINFAILETNGQLSVMPKSLDRPATAAEAGLQPSEGALLSNVIMDGKILKGNCKAFGKAVDWVAAEVKRQGASLTDVILGTLDDEGNLNLYYKEEGGDRTCFI